LPAATAPSTPEPDGGLQPVAEGIWTQAGDRLRLAGIPFDTRAVVVRLPGGGLWLHSPVCPTPARVAALAALGPVAHVVAPNRIHGAFTADWAARAPGAKVWVSPRFPDRHPGIRHDALLGDTPPPDWSGTLDQCLFAGHAWLDEVVFLHRPSRSLIVADLLQRHDPAREAPLWRVLKGAFGLMAPGGGVPPDLRLTFRDRAAARAARDRILGWAFDRILLPHSVPVETGGKAVFARAFAWL
jgi:hypothetical protein